MSDLSNFVKLVVAKVKGDEAEVAGLKIQKRASAAIAAQVAAKQAHTLTLEDNLDSAKEKQASALINNGDLITDNSQYIKNLLTTEVEVKAAQQALDNHKEEISFLEGKLAEVRA